MTYNFDPDAFYDRQRALLEARHRRGELDDEALAAAIEELERRYEALEAGLDRPFELP